ncbi:hypothetical protein ANO11243_011330 [Dothideomycetidae sp. 11243]|nr:hypothetical protein ANO11243_011330 [fungal sp. No.11243]
MAPQRYERVAEHDDEDLPITDNELHHQESSIPSSPPPSFRSRVSSRRGSISQNAPDSDVERSLDDAFGGSHDSDEEDEEQESRRLVSSPTDAPPAPGALQRRVTEFPGAAAAASATTTPRVYGGGSGTRDGVFANISAKPTREDDLEEKPPTYEQAAADATPPYWETTILTPAGYSSDDIFVDGLMVGSLFSFVWNALISMSFQLIGFLLTYLLHTTHAAKHGSRAGLGITLIQYGFTMSAAPVSDVPAPGMGGDVVGGVPPDPNDHDFDPSAVTGDATGAGGMAGGTYYLSYILMIAGWFILIRAATDFVRARRQEQLIRNSPDRGLPVPIVAEGEGERAV